MAKLRDEWQRLILDGEDAVVTQGVPASRIDEKQRLVVRYEVSDTAIQIRTGCEEEISARLEATHMAGFGFVRKEKYVVIDCTQVETMGRSPRTDIVIDESDHGNATDATKFPIVTDGKNRKTLHLYDESPYIRTKPISGRAVLHEATGPTIVEAGW